MSEILIVDDSVSVRKALERILQSQNDTQVIAAESAEKALEVLTETLPDLIIADIVMPGIDGFELCQTLKGDERFKDVPVILISGIVNTAVTDQAATAGAFDVIKKPFNPTDLIPVIESALSQNSGDEAPKVKVSLEPRTGNAEFAEGSLEAALQPFLEKTDIGTVLLTNKVGDCLLTVGKPLEGSATIASYFKFFGSAAGVMGASLDAAALECVLLAYERSCLLYHGIDEDHAIILVMRSATGQNVARFLLTKQLPIIKQALQTEMSAV